MREFFCILAAFSEGVPPRHCRAEHTAGFRTRGGAYTMKSPSRASPFTSRALFTIVGGAVLINPALHRNSRTSRARCSKKSWSPVCAAASRPRWTSSAKPSASSTRSMPKTSASFPDTNLSRGAATNHRRLHRSPQRRGRHGHGARLRPAVQHGDAQRPADAGGRCVRQWRADRRRRVRQRTLVQFRQPRRRSRSARSRSTRPGAPTSPPAASVPRSTCAPRVRSTTTGWC